MTATRWVVRDGNVRGEGCYLDDDDMWVSRQRSAYAYHRHQAALDDAKRRGGRVVRLKAKGPVPSEVRGAKSIGEPITDVAASTPDAMAAARAVIDDISKAYRDWEDDVPVVAAALTRFAATQVAAESKHDKWTIEWLRKECAHLDGALNAIKRYFAAKGGA